MRTVGVSSYAALGVGVLGTAVFCAVFLGAGALRGWNVSSVTHQYSWTLVYNDMRFEPEPMNTTADRMDPKRTGAAASGWYYWKLPRVDVTPGTRAFAWILYAAHQAAVWAALYYAQATDTKYAPPNTSYAYTWWMLLVNAIFHVLMLVRTHTTYDGLAQDVSEASSQGSVILMLVLIIVFEARDRGVFVGWPKRKPLRVTHSKDGDAAAGEEKAAVPLYKRLLRCCGCAGDDGSCVDDGAPTVPNTPLSTRLLRRYHGYIFAWAATYTAHYHVTESVLAHVTGYAHTSLILVQGSLAYTPAHLNRYWRLVVEAWVLLHGTVVALTVQHGTPTWRMFFFGFAFMLFITQLHGLPPLLHSRLWQRLIAGPLVFVAIVLAVYGGMDTWSNLDEPWRIPAIELLLALLMAFTLWCVYRLRRLLRSPRAAALTTGERRAYEAANVVVEQVAAAPAVWLRVVLLAVVVVCFAIMVVASWLVEMYALSLDLITLAVVLIIIYWVLGLVAFVCIDSTLPAYAPVLDDNGELKTIADNNGADGEGDGDGAGGSDDDGGEQRRAPRRHRRRGAQPQQNARAGGGGKASDGAAHRARAPLV